MRLCLSGQFIVPSTRTMQAVDQKYQRLQTCGSEKRCTRCMPKMPGKNKALQLLDQLLGLWPELKKLQTSETISKRKGANKTRLCFALGFFVELFHVWSWKAAIGTPHWLWHGWRSHPAVRYEPSRWFSEREPPRTHKTHSDHSDSHFPMHLAGKKREKTNEVKAFLKVFFRFPSSVWILSPCCCLNC